MNIQFSRRELFHSRWRWASLLSVTLFVLLLLYVVLVHISSWWIDKEWFSNLGYSAIFTRTKILNYVTNSTIFFLIFLILTLNGFLIFKRRDSDRMIVSSDSLDVYREFIFAHKKSMLFIPTAAIALFIVALKGDFWVTIELWAHAQQFGIADPQFHKDFSFYAFSLPFYRLIANLLLVVEFIALTYSLILLYIFSSVSVREEKKLNFHSRIIIIFWMVTILLTKAYSYWLDRYELLNSQVKPLLNGATYSVINAEIPAKIILMFFCVICALVFLGTIFLKDFRLANFSLVIFILSSFVFSIGWPNVMEKFTVKPNEVIKEAEYINRNITATQNAFGLIPVQSGGNVQTVQNGGITHEANPNKIGIDEATENNVRILDPDLMGSTFTKLKGERQYYAFPNSLNSDRYTIDGKMTNFVVGVRELDPSKLDQGHQDWNNRHVVFTHGNGFFAADATHVNAPAANSDVGGDPIFYVPKNGNDPLHTDNPRIYFGPIIGSSRSDYAVVGGGDVPREWDSPKDRYHYQGKGVPVGSWWQRLAFTMVDSEPNFLLSKDVNSDSSVLTVRDPRQRVHKIAPWLHVDPKTYPAVINHKIYWIVDAYTVLSNYPYSQHVSAATAQSSGLTEGGDIAGKKGINYIRNSVKATVDAYTGEVSLYATDESDPILRTWRSVFPELIKPLSAAPHGLLDHFRYPTGLFNLQRFLLMSYHGSQSADFFQRTDQWSLPNNSQNKILSPNYVVMADPRTGVPSFQLVTSMLSNDATSVAATVEVSNDPATYGHMTMRLMNRDLDTKNLPSPASAFYTLIQTVFNYDKQRTTPANQLTYGTVLTLPMSNGNILYVMPVYLQSDSTQGLSFYRVLVYTSQKTDKSFGYGPDTATALKQMGITSATPSSFIPIPPPTHAIPRTSKLDKEAINQQILSAIAGLNAARKDGNIDEFFKYLSQLDNAIKQWQAVNNTTATPPVASGYDPGSQGNPGVPNVPSGPGAPVPPPPSGQPGQPGK